MALLSIIQLDWDVFLAFVWAHAGKNICTLSDNLRIYALPSSGTLNHSSEEVYTQAIQRQRSGGLLAD